MIDAKVQVGFWFVFGSSSLLGTTVCLTFLADIHSDTFNFLEERVANLDGKILPHALPIFPMAHLQPLSESILLSLKCKKETRSLFIINIQIL